MAYDERLADRIRDLLIHVPNLTEKKMFGGIGWMIGGHMATGASSKGGLIVRCSKADHGGLLAEPGAGGFGKSGKPMSGWVVVQPEFVDDEADLARWVGLGRAYAESLPPK